MRVVLVGDPGERARLRSALATAGIEVAAEFESMADVRAVTTLPVVAADMVADDGEDDEYGEKLTARESDVLELLSEGLSNKFIAARLGISDQTVKFHIAAILGKLGAANRTDAVRRALRRGLIHL